MKLYAAPVPFVRGQHETAGFECGSESLDIWLQRYAGQSQSRDAARTFVVVDSARVVGYYALVVAEIDIGEASSDVARGMSTRFPIPVVKLARLAVDRKSQRTGLGGGLLLDALERSVRASEDVGIRAVVVDAIDQSAESFYKKHGFEASELEDDVLMIRLRDVREMLAR